MIPVSLVVLAKAPRPGRVKTRLTPPYTPDQAARLAAAALSDTLDALGGVPVAHRVLAIDGPVSSWGRPGFDIIGQRGDGLDERLTHAFEDVWGAWGLPMLLVGMDTPQVTAVELAEAAARLAEAATPMAMLGPAHDGGFWSLGLRSPCPAGLIGVPMSTSRTGQATVEHLRAAGLDVRLLAQRRDVDDAASAAAVAALAPRTAFARAYETLGPQGMSA